MTGDLLSLLANLGAGALLGFFALPLLARMTAPRFVHDPASSHRALLWALCLASSLVLVPWVRAMFPRGEGIPASGPHEIAGTAVFSVPTSTAASGASVLGFHVLSLLGAAWALAAALAAALACVSLVQLIFLIRRATPAAADVADVVRRCRSRGAEKIRRVLVSEEASVPFAAVPWAPVIVLPAALCETFDRGALELIVEHEAAHLDRGDLWTTALVRALCVLFPFHPVAARVADEIAFAREAAVDARVSTRDPRRYATLLLEVAAHARFDQVPRPVSMDDRGLKRRIDLLTDGARRRHVSLAPLTITTAALAAAALLIPMPSISVEPATRMGAIRDGPFDAQGSAGAELVVVGPDTFYAACEGRSAGDGCSTTEFSDGTCRTNAENDRLFCAPPPPPSGRGRGAFHLMLPESAYAACASKGAGDRCSTPEFAGERVCVTNPENDRLFCPPPPPPDDAVFHFHPRAR
jgi:beta-lactamase regulating signal transducer with metallopeptidase domain